MSENQNARTISPFALVQEAFRKIFAVFASVPEAAWEKRGHPGWREPFERDRLLIDEFSAAVAQARRVPGVLAENATIQQAEDFVRKMATVHPLVAMG